MSIDQLHELSRIADDLTDTEAIIEVWWALEYWQVRRDRISQAGQLAQEADRDGGP
jgi:hypothetical protein